MLRPLVLIICILFLTSCKKESLQSYFVETQEKTEFYTLNTSTNIAPIDKDKMSLDDKKAYESVKKINLTALLIQNAKAGQYDVEKNRLKTIFKNSDYKKLTNIKTNGKHATIYYLGEADAIDEIIVFGYSNDLGVGVARILGENMNPYAIINMAKNLDNDNLDIGQFKGILEQIKP